MNVLLNHRTLRLLLLILLCWSLPERSPAQWVKLTQFNGTFYNEVFFASSTVGFITSHTGTIHRTTDGGDSWGTVTLPDAGFSSNRDIAFPTAQTGFISGEDGIWKSTDGGATWSEVTPSAATGVGSSSCWFRNASVGIWAYGSCQDTIVTFWRTSDGGSSWSITRDTATTDVAVGGITYSGGEFRVAGGSGKFWRSTDDGATWSYSNTNSAGWQEDLIEFQGTLLIASADGTSCGSTGGGKILRSTNGGTSWNATSWTSVVMWGVSMYSSTNGIAVGDRGAAFRTTDGGATWGTHSCGLAANDRLDDVFMISATNGFAVGDGVYRYRVDTFAAIPDTIDFGNVIVGTTSPYQSALVRSLGSNGSITGRAFSGFDAGSFTSTANFGATLAVPSCVDVGTPIRFEPLKSGPHVARFDITLGGSAGTLSVVLLGNGVRPKLDVGDLLEFDTILCETERIDSIEVRNLGSHELVIDSVQIANDLGFFTLLSPLPQTIAPFATGRLRFHARASGTGTMSARAYIFSNDPDYRDSSRMIRLRMVRDPFTLDLTGLTSDTVVIPSRPFGETSSACIELLNGTRIDISVTGVTSLDNVPEIVAEFPGDPKITPATGRSLCFRAAANDSIVRYERFMLRTSPCDQQRTLVVCYQARPAGLDVPSELNLSGPCGEDLSAEFFITNDGQFPVRLDSVSSRNAAVTVTSDPIPTIVEPGDTVRIRSTWGGSGRGTQVTRLLVYQENGVDTVELRAVWSGPDLRFAGDDPVEIEICRDDTAIFDVRVSNDGEFEGVAALRLEPTGELLMEGTSETIQPGDTAGLQLRIPGFTPGRHVMMLLLERGCGLLDTLDVNVNVRISPVRFSRETFDLGTLSPGSSLPVQVSVINGSPEPVVDLQFESSDPLLLLPSGPGPYTVPASDSGFISVEVDAGDPGQHQALLVLDSDAPCSEPDTLLILWKVPGGEGGITLREELGDGGCDSVLLGRLEVHAPFDRSATVDTVWSTGRNDLTVDPLPGRLEIPAGESMAFDVRILYRGVPEVRDTLIVVLDGDPLSAPLHGTWTRPASMWSDAGESVDSLRVVMLRGCEAEPVRLSIRNLGNRADTLQLRTGSPSISFPSGQIVTVEPESTLDLDVLLASGPGGTETIEIVLESLVCNASDSLVLQVERLDSPFRSDTTIDIGPHCADSARHLKTVIPLSGLLARTVAIDSVHVEPDNAWSLVGYNLLPDHSGIELDLQSRPEAGEEIVITVTFADPCATSHVVRLRSQQIDCRASDITISAPLLQGVWGDTVVVPISILHRGGPVADTISAVIRVDRRFLRILSIESPETSEWRVRNPVVEDASGEIIWFGERTADGSVEVTGPEVIAQVRGVILRGPVSFSHVRFDTGVSNPGTSISWVDGTVALTDFCDSYGRLLEVLGEPGIRSALPNPTDGQLSVRYYVPVLTTHIISLVDMRGATVWRREIAELSPGERIEELDLSGIATGHYLLVIEAGRFRFVEEIVRR